MSQTRSLLGLSLLRGLRGVCKVPAVRAWRLSYEGSFAFRVGNPFVVYNDTCWLSLFSVLRAHLNNIAGSKGAVEL